MLDRAGPGRSRRSRRLPFVFALAAALLGFGVTPGQPSGQAPAVAQPSSDRLVRDVVLAIHGGAGTIRREDFPPEREAQYKEALRGALQRGYDVLQDGGTSVEAVEAAVTFLEDSELFNAGKGAVFTTDAANELDASIMDGRTLDAGAVTGVMHIKNPISLARDLMERSRHVMLAGQGAELYAQHRGFDLVTQEYFFTERRWQSLLSAKGGNPTFNFGEEGTVGAVALNDAGDLAAATSTGGLTNKPMGRIGDSPIIGAGTYADNDTVAVSCTGTGEFFIRQSAAHNISAAMEYGRMRVDRAAQTAIDKVAELGGPGTGGVIALDNDGNLSVPFNTDGMFRGWVTEDGQIVVKMFADE
jgi:beta-aspartyl-peptidase (threonine type)